ncbi:MAG TPA: hypothetical protein VL728_19570 [Cyclobacteriaceae bacterium]|jgi:hypothetical protein|nr:hypothetical protein [Cyclobacteriaceae bacterium]
MSLMLVTILAYTVALPACVGLYFYRSLPIPLRTLSVLFAIATFVEILSTVYRSYFSNNLIIINVYIIIEAWLCLLFVSQCIGKIRLTRSAQLAVLAVGLIETVINPKTFATVSSTLESVVIIIGIIFLFFQVALGTNILKTVYFMAGILLFYFASNTIYFLTRGLLEMDSLIFVSIIHVWINAGCNLFYAFILWKASHSRSLLLA